MKRHLASKVAAALTVILPKRNTPLLSAWIPVCQCVGYVIESFVRVRGRLLPLICFPFHALSRCRELASPRSRGGYPEQKANIYQQILSSESG